MLPILLAAFLLGIVAGLRTFTAPAALWLIRYGGIWAIALGVMALVEYAGDLYPKSPPRTGPVGLAARLISGGFVGWWIGAAAAGGSSNGPAVTACIAGIVGAAVGAYGGLAVRVRAIAAIGAIPSGIAEDVIAIALAVLVVSHTPA